MVVVVVLTEELQLLMAALGELEIMVMELMVDRVLHLLVVLEAAPTAAVVAEVLALILVILEELDWGELAAREPLI